MLKLVTEDAEEFNVMLKLLKDFRMQKFQKVHQEF